MPWDALRHLDSNIHRPSDQLRYVLALLFFAAALALDFTPLARSLPSLAFIAAVALSARFGGFRPALVTTVASAAAVDCFFVSPPRIWSFRLIDVFQILALAQQVTIRFDLYYAPFEKWFHITADPTPGRLTVFYQDITERKAAEDALRRSEKLATAGRLAATMAHEINNPLEGITNLLFLLRHNSSLDGKARKHLEMADQEVSRLSHLAKQSLGFYRDHSAPSQVDLEHMMDEVLTIHHRRLQAKDILVEKQYDSVATVTGIPGELRQVMLNLVLNAIDAVEESGRLSVRIRNTRDWSDSARPGVRITIADNGCGISKEHLPHLFEPFYTTKKDFGTGLGLWISRELVSKHDGWIRVRSTTAPGKQGTAFSVFIPKTGLSDDVQEASPSQIAS